MKNRTSIKQNLILKLSTLIFTTLLIAYSFSFQNTKKEIYEVFDADIIKSAKLLFEMIKHESFIKNNTHLDEQLKQKILNRYEYKIHAQAWKNYKLIYNSGEDLKLQKPNYQGFADIKINKEKWRGFSFYDEESQITLLVLEKKSIRNSLIFEIILSLLIPLIISFIPIFFVIISVTKNEIKPLDLMAKRIAEISSKTLKKFNSPKAPKELQPFLASFNSLLERLSNALESEKCFTNYAAHELNTPLATIKLQAQMIAKNNKPEKRDEYVANLLISIDRAIHLIEQLLTLSRLETAENFSKEEFDLAKIAQFICKNYEEKILAKNLRIEFELEESRLNGNRTYIEILISNLLENAIKYSPKSEIVKIKIHKKSEKIIFTITNSGSTLSKNEVEKIFDNFYRINKSEIERGVVGSGLGLSIAKKIVELHRGKISFTSHDKINSVSFIIHS